MNDIGAELLRQFPLALQADKGMQIMAAVIARALALRWQEAELGLLYPRLDELPETLLDILAYDFKVDWWDPEYDLEAKRRILKTSWQVHQTLGTKAAVETAASAVYPITSVQEWFEYGGEPYRFRLNVDLPEDEWTPERHKRLMWRLQYYKNLRSHLDSVTYQVQPVVLENRQAFWFAALNIRLRLDDLGGGWGTQGLALETVWTAVRARQAQGNALCLTIGGRVSEELSGALRLLIRVWADNFDGRGPVRFNGRRLMDGTVWFDQRDITGPKLIQAAIRVRTTNQNGISAAVSDSGGWKLDGKFDLDGKRRLNTGSGRSEL